MAEVTYVVGDATRLRAGGPAIIAHVCNDIGGWGRGFVVAVTRRWPEPEREYRRWFRAGFELGQIQLVPVEPDLWVANMIGQHDIRRGPDGTPPIRYAAIEQCLATLADRATELGASVHMPRIGAGLAGGHWDDIEPLILRTLSARDIPVTIYDLP